MRRLSSRGEGTQDKFQATIVIAEKLLQSVSMWNSSSPQAIAARLSTLFETLDEQRPADRADRATRTLLAAVASHEPATLGDVAKTAGRGAPATSRAVEALVRAGHVDRTPDPDNRRRLALRLTDQGRALLDQRGTAGGRLVERIGRLAQSELRAVERAVEILERLPK
ncbi:MAG: MarR family transcriptional regulator [Pseudomonadota bacterium]|nr:MarR family transcriptional regulator [Pseudomonadota bacterium]